jgi:hypothetical protein
VPFVIVVVGIEVVAGPPDMVGAGESLPNDDEFGGLVVEVFISTGEAVISGAVGPTVVGVG